MDPTQNTQQETYRLVKENNRMLHTMRRHAVIGGVLKFLFYVVFLVVLPLWLYTTYLAPIVESTASALGQMQDAGTGAQLQINNLQKLLSQFDPSGYFGQ